jgi:hypothetical protein
VHDSCAKLKFPKTLNNDKTTFIDIVTLPFINTPKNTHTTFIHAHVQGVNQFYDFVCVDVSEQKQQLMVRLKTFISSNPLTLI